jgi:hypothetical protein
MELELKKAEIKPSYPALTTAFTLLRLTFGIVPIVAGLDKFTNLLADWENYLHPMMVEMLPIGTHAFMMIIGVVEILAGILVLVRPQIGGYVVAAWLSLIAATLLARGIHLDVAVRDLVMAVGAYSLTRVAKALWNLKRNKN